MGTIHEIEEAIHKLPDNDLASLRAWFAEFDAALWDRQLESDVADGRLDALADETLRDARWNIAPICEPPREPAILGLFLSFTLEVRNVTSPS